MNRRMGVLTAILAMVACVTPMEPDEVEEVTTCNGTDLATIRKNLLLDGFKIEQESTEDLVTDFKQSDFWNGDRRYIRLTAVKVGDNVFKLKVRTRTIRIYQRDHIGMGVTNHHSRHRHSNTVILDFSRPLEVEHEQDMEYYEEHRDQHVALKQRICGSVTSAQPSESID